MKPAFQQWLVAPVRPRPPVTASVFTSWTPACRSDGRSFFSYLCSFSPRRKSSSALFPECSDRFQTGCWPCLCAAPPPAPTEGSAARRETGSCVSVINAASPVSDLSDCPTPTYVILAIGPGLFVIYGEEQHIPKIQIWKKMTWALGGASGACEGDRRDLREHLSSFPPARTASVVGQI